MTGSSGVSTTGSANRPPTVSAGVQGRLPERKTPDLARSPQFVRLHARGTSLAQAPCVMAQHTPVDPDPSHDAAIHRFGEFELEPRIAELRWHGEPQSIARKSLMVLAYLVANSERVVARSELMDALWPNIRVGEGSLHQAIWEIRKVLREAPGGPRFIETRWGRGYRFAVPVDTQKRPDNLTPARPTRVERGDRAEPSSSSESSVTNSVTLAAVPAMAVARATLVSIS